MTVNIAPNYISETRSKGLLEHSPHTPVHVVWLLSHRNRGVESPQNHAACKAKEVYYLADPCFTASIFFLDSVKKRSYLSIFILTQT